MSVGETIGAIWCRGEGEILLDSIGRPVHGIHGVVGTVLLVAEGVERRSEFMGRRGSLVLEARMQRRGDESIVSPLDHSILGELNISDLDDESSLPSLRSQAVHLQRCDAIMRHS